MFHDTFRVQEPYIPFPPEVSASPMHPLLRYFLAVVVDNIWRSHLRKSVAGKTALAHVVLDKQVEGPAQGKKGGMQLKWDGRLGAERMQDMVCQDHKVLAVVAVAVVEADGPVDTQPDDTGG
ncbi:hypothetical protein HK097_002253 [Rhizophlyctis rosea]|uniref:Uncharacterized protein n=1 Tax=Rhizophlyctis rosea TaxID=64517 RepID=A0AAD5SMZ1_9FUNG|nr:hypothetical protein HK097_002253 [Rhizophlyctis rosea]